MVLGQEDEHGRDHHLEQVDVVDDHLVVAPQARQPVAGENGQKDQQGQADGGDDQRPQQRAPEAGAI